MGELGILQWFHFDDREQVERALDDLRALGITELRTGFSWADWCRPGGKEWFEWLIPKLSSEVRVLPCFTYTPPSLGIEAKTNSPPRKIAAYAAFIDEVLRTFGDYFDCVELWNEPNNDSEWNSKLDPGWERFSRMVAEAAKVCHRHEKVTVLGGMSPLDPQWLEHAFASGLMEHIDVVGIHGFPGTWESRWQSWEERVRAVQEVLDRHRCKAAIWVTEAGYSTWQGDEEAQVRSFQDVLATPVDRIYWYSLYDLATTRKTVRQVTMGHRDRKEYHFGLKTSDGREKLLFQEWKRITLVQHA
jgi:CDP-paratose 2-epimerase